MVEVKWSQDHGEQMHCKLLQTPKIASNDKMTTLNKCFESCGDEFR